MRKQHTVLEEITDLKWEKHITQLWASSWTGRKFSDQPCFQVVNLALEHSANTTHNHCHLTLFKIPTVYSVFDIYRLVVLLFFMWPSVSAFPLKPLCSAQPLHNPRVVHIQNAGPRWLFAIHIPRILIFQKFWPKKGKFKDFLDLLKIHSKFPTKTCNTKISDSTVFHVRFDCATMTCRSWNGRLNAQVVLSILFLETSIQNRKSFELSRSPTEIQTKENVMVH